MAIFTSPSKKIARKRKQSGLFQVISSAHDITEEYAEEAVDVLNVQLNEITTLHHYVSSWETCMFLRMQKLFQLENNNLYNRNSPHPTQEEYEEDENEYSDYSDNFVDGTVDGTFRKTIVMTNNEIKTENEIQSEPLDFLEGDTAFNEEVG